MSEQVYDIAIIGGGPAGVSAAINAKILNKNFIWFSSGAASKKVERAELINGEVIMMAPAPSRAHQGISMELSRQFANYLEGKKCKTRT